MDIIRYQRRAGKTVWMMQAIQNDPNGILVCINQQEIDRLMQDYPHVPVGRFITFEEVRNGGLRGLRPEPNLYVDNLDMMLLQIFGHRIVVASVTVEV